MSDRSLVLGEVKDQLTNLETDELVEMYEDHFGCKPYVEGTEDITGDKTLLIRKLSYSVLLRRYDEQGEDVPARVMTLSQKAFDAPFKGGKVEKGIRKGTIQQLIVDRLWECMQTGERPTVSQLADEVVAAFPNSTYVNAPVARMRADINKFNKGVFLYAQAEEKIPTEPFVPSPEVAEAAAE